MENIENQEKLQTNGENAVAVEEKKPKRLSPSPQNIRKVMDKTGWTAYETYRHMREVYFREKINFNTFVKQKLWYEYKVEEAEAAFDKDRKNFKTTIKLKEFNTLFYTEEQREAIKQFKAGVVTFKALCDFLQVEPPEDFTAIAPDEDVIDKLAFRSVFIKKNSIYFCTRQSTANPKLFEKKPPVLIIGYPIFEKKFEETGIPYIPCKFLSSYLIEISRFWRNSLKAKVVGITGSYGKTSTTDMIATVVGDSKNMYKVWNNNNVLAHIERHLFNVQKDTEVFVQECSGAGIGVLEKVSNAISPNIWVVTNVGTCHIGAFRGNQKLLLHEKIAFDRHSKKNAIGVINWDDPLLKEVNYRHKIISYSMSDPEADYHAENIVERDGRITCDIVEKDGTRTAVVINLFGIHNVYNALTAFIVGSLLGIEKDRIVKSIASFKTTGVRQNLVNLGGHKVFLDCFNATDASIKSALVTAGTITVSENNHKYAVIGDVLELGDSEEEVHRNIGRIISEVDTVDKVFLYGKSMKYAFEEATKLGVTNCCYSDDRSVILEWLNAELKDGDLVVLKGSHGMQMTRFVDTIYGTDYLFEDKLLVEESVKKTVNNQTYVFIEDHGCAISRGPKRAETVDLPNEVDGYSLKIIGSSSFKGSALTSIEMPESVVGIGNGAFSNCENLKDVSFSPNMKHIGVNAFSGCSKLKRVHIPEGVTTINEGAFSDCKKLKRVAIPPTVKTIIAPFDKKWRIKIYCEKGSYAHQWAKENGYRVRHKERYNEIKK